MGAIAYDVFRKVNGRTVKIDTVWFTGYTADEARKSLIDHDGYPSDIIVRRAK